MEDYKEVTSSLEGRLYLSASRPRRTSTNVEDYFQPRPDTQAVVNSWLSLKSNNSAIATKPILTARSSQRVQNSAADGSSRCNARHGNLSALAESKPSTSGQLNAFRMRIELAEPVLHLEGFDALHTRAHRSTVLRGLLKLDVVQKTILKGLSLTFRGISRTEWPESWRLRKLKKVCDETIIAHSWDFMIGNSSARGEKAGKSRTFEPGYYIMNFELPLESSLPETIDLPLGGVTYTLSASATTQSSHSLTCTKGVMLIRIPCACSLELVEPYGVHGSQHGLRYSFGLFAKSVAIGGRVPLSMRIASIPEVSWERITVSIVEDVQYGTRDGLAQREQSRTKAILLEKRAAVRQGPVNERVVRRISHTGEKLRHAHAGLALVEKPPRRGSTASTEPEVSLLEKAMLNIPTCSVLQPDTAYSCIYVRHHLVIMIMSRINLDEMSHRNFEVQIKVPVQILTCKLTKGNATLPEYKEQPEGATTLEQPPLCGCEGSSKRIVEMPALEEEDSMLERWTSGSTRSVWQHELPGYDDLI